ncbi:MAG: alpha-ketoacid dehydrogenase subunit beta [Alphaproteobacteria bacterium]|nr:MAG: alpha-ketoacid dehydrogenase subunit beta [Alphaproteobacteria bacterium]
MPEMTMAEAIAAALDTEMAHDPHVILLGEDVRAGAMGVTDGLVARHGPDRVIDMPISEAAFIGAAVGAAATGLRPVVELMFADFIGVCFDAVLNQMAKLRYMTGGQVRLPLVLRTTIGAGDRAAAQHSQSLHHLFTSIPGLKCVVPATPADAHGLLLAAIRDPDPVIVCEHKMLYPSRGAVPEAPEPIPLDEARTVRPGRDLTIVAYAAMVHQAEAAVVRLAAEGIEAEIIDPRATAPLDATAILASVKRTGRLIVVDEGAARCGMAADIVALVSTRAFDALKAPPVMITPPHTPVPFAPALEDAWLPGADAIIATAPRLCAGGKEGGAC